MQHEVLTGLISGSVGGACAILAGQPFDVLKCRMQALSGCGGIISYTQKIFQDEGFRAFYKGTTPALSSAMTENVVVWSTNEFLRDQFERHLSKDEQTSSASHGVLGLLTGAFSSAAICPAEVLKIRQQTASSSLSSLQAASLVYKESGVLGFYRGLVPLLARDMPFYLLFFASMEAYFSMIRSRNRNFSNGSNDVSLLHSAIAGGFAGSFAWSVIFPIDVIKTRIQAFPGNGIWATLGIVLRTNGFMGLYGGWLPAVVRALPANGALVCGVHATRKLLKEDTE